MTSIMLWLVVALVLGLAACGLWRYRVTIHVDDTLIDELIRQKGIGADPLPRSSVIVYHKPRRRA